MSFAISNSSDNSLQECIITSSTSTPEKPPNFSKENLSFVIPLDESHFSNEDASNIMEAPERSHQNEGTYNNSTNQRMTLRSQVSRKRGIVEHKSKNSASQRKKITICPKQGASCSPYTSEDTRSLSLDPQRRQHPKEPLKGISNINKSTIQCRTLRSILSQKCTKREYTFESSANQHQNLESNEPKKLWKLCVRPKRNGRKRGLEYINIE